MTNRYTAVELASITGVPQTTLRLWITRGVLMPADATEGGGGNRTYTDAHLRRIREVRALQDTVRTLADIRDHFDPLPEDDDE